MNDLEPLNQELAHFVRLNSQVNTRGTDNVEWRLRADITDVNYQTQLPLMEERIVEPQNHGSSVTEHIWSVLTHKRFRQGAYESLSTHRRTLLGQVETAIGNQETISLVLPTIPFKDQSAISTGQSPDVIDLGEHAMVAQFRDLLSSIRNVYPPGAQLHLVSDGLVYRSMCENTTANRITAYSNRVAETIGAYGLSDNVDITDFSDIIREDDGFALEQGSTSGSLQRELRHGNEHMRTLQRGMLANMWIEDMDMSSTLQTQYLPIENWPKNIRENTGRVACEYASFILTAARRNTLSRRFPGSIRATVHPKNSPQLPLHIVNRRSRLLPYNGVPVIDAGDTSLRNSLRIVRLSTLLGSGNSYIRHTDNSGNALYYEQTGENENA